MDSRDETAIKLIRSIKKRPALWKRDSSEYKDKKTGKQDGWLEVANELQTTVKYCRNKWSRIRTNFLKYVKNNTPEQYNLYEETKFIFPHLNVVKKGTPVIEIEDSDGSDVDEDDVESNEESYQPQFESEIKKEEEEIELEPDIGNFTEEPEESNIIEGHYARKRNAPRESNEYKMPTLKRRRSSNANQDQASSSHMSQQLEEENPMMLFFKSILPDLMNLPFRKQRLFKTGCLDLINTLYRDEPDSN